MHLIDKRHLKVINYFASTKLEIRKLVARPCQKILIIFLAYCFANTGTWLSPAQGWFSGWFVFYVQVFYVRYGIIPSNTSSASQCGTSFSVDHAMPLWYVLLGDFLWSYTGNEVQDLTVSLLAEVCHNVVTEPSLEPITSETFLLSMPTPIMMLIWILRPEVWSGARMRASSLIKFIYHAYILMYYNAVFLPSFILFTGRFYNWFTSFLAMTTNDDCD